MGALDPQRLNNRANAASCTLTKTCLGAGLGALRLLRRLKDAACLCTQQQLSSGGASSKLDEFSRFF